MATLTTLICKNCGKEFIVKKGREKKTCSDKCKKELRNKQDEKFYVTKECEVCNKEFKSKKKENKKYCSYKCSAEAKSIQASEIRKCQQCGNEFTVRKKYKKMYCSDNCRLIATTTPEHKKLKIAKSQEVLLNRYGVKTYFDTDEFKQMTFNIDYEQAVINNKVSKLKNHNNSNYNNYDKILDTKKKKYNDKNYNNRIKFKNTINQKFLEKYSKSEYKIIEFLDNDNLKVQHPDGHIFEITRSLFIIRSYENREISTQYQPQNSNISNGELEIRKYLDSLYIEYEINNKSLINPYELDIFIPKHNLAIEFNGLYWHSELYKNENYHNNKTNMTLNKNIQLLHIFEDEWHNKKEIVKSIISGKLKLTKNKIYARKCNIVEIRNNKIVREFLEKNHIQGYSSSIHKLGLYYNNELVGLMTFEIMRKGLGNNVNNPNFYNLARFATKLNTHVIGGASKLLAYFIKTYHPEKIISYADRRYSNGNLYMKLGFDLIKINMPTYYYCDLNQIKRYHRFNFRKEKIIKDNYDKNLTEKEIMLKNKIYRIYDSGIIKFELDLTKKATI